MNKLDLNGFHLITAFLAPLDIKRLGICSKQNKEMCKHFMTYSYNEHGCDEHPQDIRQGCCTNCG